MALFEISTPKRTKLHHLKKNWGNMPPNPPSFATRKFPNPGYSPDECCILLLLWFTF